MSTAARMAPVITIDANIVDPSPQSDTVDTGMKLLAASSSSAPVSTSALDRFPHIAAQAKKFSDPANGARHFEELFDKHSVTDPSGILTLRNDLTRLIQAENRWFTPQTKEALQANLQQGTQALLQKSEKEFFNEKWSRAGLSSLAIRNGSFSEFAQLAKEEQERQITAIRLSPLLTPEDRSAAEKMVKDTFEKTPFTVILEESAAALQEQKRLENEAQKLALEASRASHNLLQDSFSQKSVSEGFSHIHSLTGNFHDVTEAALREATQQLEKVRENKTLTTNDREAAEFFVTASYQDLYDDNCIQESIERSLQTVKERNSRAVDGPIEKEQLRDLTELRVGAMISTLNGDPLLSEETRARVIENIRIAAAEALTDALYEDILHAPTRRDGTDPIVAGLELHFWRSGRRDREGLEAVHTAFLDSLPDPTFGLGADLRNAAEIALRNVINEMGLNVPPPYFPEFNLLDGRSSFQEADVSLEATLDVGPSREWITARDQQEQARSQAAAERAHQQQVQQQEHQEQEQKREQAEQRREKAVLYPHKPIGQCQTVTEAFEQGVYEGRNALLESIAESFIIDRRGDPQGVLIEGLDAMDREIVAKRLEANTPETLSLIKKRWASMVAKFTKFDPKNLEPIQNLRTVGDVFRYATSPGASMKDFFRHVAKVLIVDSPNNFNFIFQAGLDALDDVVTQVRFKLSSSTLIDSAKAAWTTAAEDARGEREKKDLQSSLQKIRERKKEENDPLGWLKKKLKN